jgi:hypothetical protein
MSIMFPTRRRATGSSGSRRFCWLLPLKSG